MAISRLTGQDATGQSTLNSVSATYASTPTANNLLIAAVANNDSNGTVTITGWTLANGVATSVSTESYLFYKISNGAESTTVTATGGATLMKIAIYEYSGTATSNVLNSSSVSAAGFASSIQTQTVSNGDYGIQKLIFVLTYASGGAATFTSWSNGFTTLDSIVSIGTVTILATGNLITSEASDYFSIGTFNSLTVNLGSIIVEFNGIDNRWAPTYVIKA